MNQESIDKVLEETKQLNSPQSIDEWRAEYEEYQRHPPTTGDFLSTGEDDKKTKLIIECEAGKQPCVYARIIIPDIVGGRIGWFTLPEGSTSNYGLKCILLPKSRNEVITKFGMTKKEVAVKQLRVIKASQTGFSLLCEVSEF